MAAGEMRRRHDERSCLGRVVPLEMAGSPGAARLRLLHEVASAANQATTLLDVVPVVLARVCQTFGWPSGALLETAHGDHVVLAHGSFVVTPAERHLRVPLGGTVPGTARLVFDPGPGGAQPEQQEVLRQICTDLGRVVERETLAQLLSDNQRRFRSIFDLSPLAMAFTLGYAGTFATVNAALCDLLGRTAQELVGLSAHDIVDPSDRHLVDTAGQAALEAPDGRHQVELRFRHSSGRTVPTMVTLAWIDDQRGGRNLLAQIEDLSARRGAEDLLRRQAERDDLTGLGNRAHLALTMARLARTGSWCQVMFVDIDGFKVVNDGRGHAVGDEVLVEVARRLSEAVRPDDVVVRFGGDEFVVVCPAPPGPAALKGSGLAHGVSARVEKALQAPVATRQGPVPVTVSIGVAAGTVDAASHDTLVAQADAAMYQAKLLGRNRREVYGPSLHRRNQEQKDLQDLLGRAVVDRLFEVHYQPIVSLRDGGTVAVEALVRLRTEAGELLAPGRFIPVAEQTGLVVPMGAWVLETACRTVAELRERSGRDVTVSVNVAAQQVARPDLARTVLGCLEASGLPESALTLELTESALLEAERTTLDQLCGLRDLGVEIGLDDFGTGYSSLTYLRRFPVSHLKVDRSFVQGMVDSLSDRAIVSAVTRLADDLSLGWVAEGIETEGQRLAVAALGPGLAQGYLFGRPMPADRLAEHLGLLAPEPTTRPRG